MKTIMANAAERELIRMRRDAVNDLLSIKNSGRREGKLELLVDLVKDGLLSIDNAASKANMTVDDFAVKGGLKL